ncbi:MAG: sugar kinase [Rhodospirillaceae bacterium]|nr:sugar kinase [Rhodospirillaceae bacterium]
MTSSARVVCFGEVLLRLSAPGHQLFLQSPSLDVVVGGAETNVAGSLAHFGHNAAMVSTLPDNAVGRAVLGEIRKHGIDTSFIRFAPGRMGLYFVTMGAAVRPSEVTYDRAHSAFADDAPEAVNWDAALKGAAWFHISGVTPALGPNGAKAAQRAADAARRMNVPVSFDGNFRSKLWAAWKGDAPGILKGLMASADLAFIDDRDVAVILGQQFSAGDDLERRRAAAKAAFTAFPQLKRIACTVRVTSAAQAHQLSAIMFTRGSEHKARTYALEGVVDRIGGGDAFAAGVLHGLITKMDDAAALEFGLAAACLKHSYPGDINLAHIADVEDVLKGPGGDIRR